ncbi:MAG: hypothetical protein WKG01_06325 [Kofleriaceae bacterium]
MANPPYMQPPPGGHGGPMQGGPMQGGPMQGGPMGSGPMQGGPMQGGPPRAQAVRRGTSKAVPVVVSAGLAVGVFCGLLFGLGTNTGDATAAPSSGNNVKASDKDEVPEAFAPTQNKVVKPTAGSGTVAAGSAVEPGSGSVTVDAGSGSAGSAVPAVVKTKLTVEVRPEAAAKVAKIEIDGKPIDGNSIDLELGDVKKKKVTIAVKASGYRDTSKDLEVDIDKEAYTIEFSLSKRSSGSSGTRPTVPGAGKKPPGGKKPGGGLIDI